MKPNPADKNLESAEKPYQNPYYSQPNYNQYVINNQQFNQYMNYPMYYPQPPMKYLNQQFNQMSFEPRPDMYYPPGPGMGYNYNYPGQPGMMMKQPFVQMNEPFKTEYENNEAYQFATSFPRALNYLDEQQVIEALPHYKDINSSLFDPDKIAHAHFFILRSTNDDDIHKAIKYQRWTSSPKNNETLSRIWRENNNKNINIPIYLFFSVVKSQQFLGVAQMMSDFDPKNSFKYWWEACKWFGSFEVKWIYIKDIKEKQFDHIRDNQTPITSFPDGTKISDKSGKQMMNIFKNANSKPNIFGAFAYMDKREDNLRSTRDNDPNFSQSFKALSEQFATNPSTFLRNKGFHKYKKPYGYGGGMDYSEKNQQYSNQELHEVMFVTSGGSKQNKENKDKKKLKKKKMLKGDSEEYNVSGAAKVEIVESSDEEEKPQEKLEEVKEKKEEKTG